MEVPMGMRWQIIEILRADCHAPRLLRRLPGRHEWMGASLRRVEPCVGFEID